MRQSVITASDALFALQAAVGARTCALCVCDVNDSGAVTASDALSVLKVAVGGAAELDCPACGTTTTSTSSTSLAPPTSTTTTTSTSIATTSTTTTTNGDIEVQVFSNACVRVELAQPIAGQAVVFTSGTAEMAIDHSTLADADFDGFEEVSAELTEIFFSESGTAFGTITVELADPAIHAGVDRRSLGEVEENLNADDGLLDLPPYAISGTAETTFETVYLQATISGGLANGRAHNDVPLEFEGIFRHSPPDPGDVLHLVNSLDVPLLDDSDGSFFSVVIDTANGATLELNADDCD
jgi:hypothetical protein